MALVYGVPTVEAFWLMTFRQFEAYRQAHETRNKERDYMNWMNGMYTLSALGTAIGQALGSKTAKYIETPLMESAEQSRLSLDSEHLDDPESLTPEEVKRQTEELFTSLAISRANLQLANLYKKLEKEKEEKKDG